MPTTPNLTTAERLRRSEFVRDSRAPRAAMQPPHR
jgi:hypothetical protein